MRTLIWVCLTVLVASVGPSVLVASLATAAEDVNGGDAAQPPSESPRTQAMKRLVRDLKTAAEDLRRGRKWDDYVKAKLAGAGRETILYGEVVEALKALPPTRSWYRQVQIPLDESRDAMIRRAAYYPLISQEEWTELLPLILPHLADTVFAVEVFLMSGRLDEDDYPARAFSGWPATEPFFKCKPDAGLEAIRKNLWSLDDYGTRRAAFLVAEFERARMGADWQEWRKWPLRHEFFAALIDASRYRLPAANRAVFFDKTELPAWVVPAEDVAAREAARLKNSDAYREFAHARAGGPAENTVFYRSLVADLRDWSEAEYGAAVPAAQARHCLALCQVVADEGLIECLPLILRRVDEWTPARVPEPGKEFFAAVEVDLWKQRDLLSVWPALRPFAALPPDKVLELLDKEAFGLTNTRQRIRCLALREMIYARMHEKGDLTANPYAAAEFAEGALWMGIHRAFPEAYTDAEVWY
jgi:hypothetical protein